MTQLLLVEDDQAEQELIRRHVERPGLPYRLEVAGSLVEGVEKLGRGAYEMAIVDYWLPDGLGTDLIPSVPAVPVVVVTGAGDADVVLNALRSGAYDYVMKDVEGRYLQLLPATVDRVLARRNAELAAHMREVQLRNARSQIAELDRFAGIVASAIRAPIQMASHCARMLATSKLEPIAETYASAALNSTRRAERILDALAEYTRIVAPVVSDVSLASCFRMASEAMARDIEDADASVEVAELPMVRGDSSLVSRVFANLLRNSIQFAEPGRSLEVVVTAEQRADRVTVRYADNSRGIPAEARHRVFDPFFSTAEDGDKAFGSGMGLTEVRKIMGLHGGSASLEPTGEGFAIRLEFPAAKGRAAEGARA